MFCRPCFNRFEGLKYIPRLFSEYMLTFKAEEPMKICVTNYIRNIINDLELPQYRCQSDRRTWELSFVARAFTLTARAV